MPLSDRDRRAVTTQLEQPQALDDLKGQVKLGGRKPLSTRYENFEEVRWWLKSAALVVTDDAGVLEAAQIIQGSSTPAIVLEVAAPPPLDLVKERKKITDDGAYSATIRGIYVQLDKDQNKHQPKEVPIGTRQIHGEKFGTYATKEWHQGTTMNYMADWAARLTGLVEGKKVDHGQATRHPIAGVDQLVSFEGFCVLLGGMRYVSFHCYPNSR